MTSPRLTPQDLVIGAKIRYVEEQWSNWFNKRNRLYGKIVSFYPSVDDEEMILVSFYFDSDYADAIACEAWKISRFILEDRIEIDTIPRTKLEKKCRKLWNNSNWVKSNPLRAY